MNTLAGTTQLTHTTSERLVCAEVRQPWFMDSIPASGTKGNYMPAGVNQS